MNTKSKNIRGDAHWRLFLGLWMGGTMHVAANGIYGNGVSAEAMSMGGAEVAWATDPLSAMTANPSGLGFLKKPEFDFGAEGAILEGRFSEAGSGGTVQHTPTGIPAGALGIPLGKWPVTLALSVAPQAALLADWHYTDPDGGLGGNVSYGEQEDKSEILLIRSALGVGVQITPKWSVGGSVGLIYDENKLVTPYIFQDITSSSVPTPATGAKTLLNLDTTGFGADATIGMLYRLTEHIQLGASYQSESIVHSSGAASGNPYAQFDDTSLPFHYNAEIKNKFPQNVSAGVAWEFLSRWRTSVEVDWIDWAQAFDSLPINLSGGSNPAVNGAVGSSLKENTPLNWSSEFVYRAGIEYKISHDWTVRLGYAYGQSPVPANTLTPLTAAIDSQVVTAGVGYHWRNFKLDVAYQYYLPASESVGQSSLRDGEYSDSTTSFSAHVLAVTTGFTF